jgi:rod shape-determining protein MreC
VTERPRGLLGVLLLVCLALTAVDARASSAFDPLRSAVDVVLGPVDRGAGRAAGTVGDAVGAVGDLVDRGELGRLREENARLRRDLAAGEASERLAGQWRSMLGLVEAGGWSVVPARVVGAGSALGFERTVTIDVGEGDGVAVGQTVVAGEGLVGRTVRVGRWTSEVLLLDDPGFGAGARLAVTGALGLASGRGGGRLRWVQVDAGPVEVGATLLTTGSETFVADVPLGRVRGVSAGPGGLTTTADVEPFVDVARIDLVGVVLDPPRVQPRPPLEPTP